MIDDRAERAGVKFKDADLIGIPWRVVVGRGAKEGKVEVIQRSTKKCFEISSRDCIEKLFSEIITN